MDSDTVPYHQDNPSL